MIILGICDSVESHACLIKNGKLISAISEERLTGIKADAGYPKNSIDKVLEIADIKPREIDIVAIAGYDNGLFQAIYKPGALFSIEDWIEQNEKYWKPKLYENKKLGEIDDFLIWKRKYPEIKNNIYKELIKKATKKNIKFHTKIFNDVRKKVICKHLKIDEKKIRIFRHETCHQYYGLFSQQQKKKKSLILTLEGMGDDSSATISLVNNEKIKEIYKTNNAMVGRLYRYTTLLLGMKPGQHEYKVMGLAPYGLPYHGNKSLKHFEKFNKIIGTKIVKTNIFKDVYYSTRKALEGERFDGIAWGLQTFTENFLKKWVLNCIKKYKIKDVILSGGVAQNIKAIKFLQDSKEIKSVWAGPISGDGSLSLGAAWLASKKLDKKNSIEGLKNIYLGTNIPNKNLKKLILKKCKNFKILNNVKNKQIARWLASGLIVARCKERMEFGQRALGNRSILADPRFITSVEKINSKIKYRDFWMPFTPSMTYEGAKKILKNPKNIYSPFMTAAFDLKDEYVEKLPGVIHPSDKSTRPQMLKEEDNPDYYNLIKEFEKITGLPVLLNTSFNLHGDAIVQSAEQALNTFLKSDLDILILNNFTIIRRLFKN
jgi:carbamoyltransferase